MAVAWKQRYTNPLENMRSYIRVHEGVDRHERQSDIEVIEQKLEAGEELARIIEFGWLLIGDETSAEEKAEWRAKTIGALQDYRAI